MPVRFGSLFRARRAPHSRGRRAPRVAALMAAVLLATGLTAPIAASAATTTVPTADVLDVDFSNGTPADHAAGRTATTYGSPTVSANASLGRITTSFNGSSDAYVYDFSDAWNATKTPNITSTVTIECWFRFDGTLPVTSENDLCSGKQSGGYSIYVTGSKIRAAFYIGGKYRYTDSSTITAGTWYHTVASYDGSTMKMYVNGTAVASTAVTGAVGAPSGRYFVLGADTNATGAPETPGVGTIAVSRVWSSALTADQAQALYAKDTATAVAVPDADVLNVDFADGGFSDKAAARTPDVFGDVTVAADAALGRSTASFDGVDDGVVYPMSDVWDSANTPTITSALSIQCDFRYNGTVPTASEKDVCSGKNTGGISVYASGSSIGTMMYIGGKYVSVTSPVLTSGVWNSVVSTYDGSTLSLYINGSLAGSTPVTGPVAAPQNDAKYFVVGGDVSGSGGTPEFQAASTVAEARIWSTVLTADQVAALNFQAFGARQVNVAVTHTTPASGSTITSPIAFSVDGTNLGQATGWSYVLDGTTPLTLGSDVGAGLDAGTHTIAITATDVFGHALSWTVSFTSARIASTGGTVTAQGKGSVTLSALATSPKGGKVTTTFTKASADAADGGFQGTVTAMPSTLDFAYDSGSTFTAAQLTGKDGVSTASIHDGIPFQRFDVSVGKTAGQRTIRWSGVVDPERTAGLYAWDTATGSWDEIVAERGQADGDTQLQGLVSDGSVDNGTVHVLVVAQDPFADDLSSHTASAATAEEKNHFEDSSNVDFSFVHWTDPQYIAEGATGGSGKWPASPTYTTSSGVQTAEEQAIWAKAYQDDVDWTVANAQSKKIVYAAATGDIINNDLVNPDATDSTGSLLYPGLNAQVNKENSFATNAFSRLQSSGIVNQVIAGNHDNQNGAETGSSSRFSQAFTAASYYTASQSWPEGASFHTMDETTGSDGATTVQGSDNQDNYVLFSAGGQDFVAVGLSYGVTKDEADWANTIFQRYKDRNGILITHAYLSASSQADGRDAATTGDGSRLYRQVVAANPNVFLVLAGHVHGVGQNLKSYTAKTVSVNHHTVELMADYQEYTLPASKIFTAETCPSCVFGTDGSIDVDGDGTTDHQASDQLKFGSSFLRLLQFNLADSTMSVDTYSPFFDEFGASSYDTKSRYNGSEDNTTFPIDLKSRTTSFSTTGLTVFSPTDEEIGAQTVTSGFPATVTWSGLAEGTTYAWTATSTTSDGTSVGTVGQFGGVFVATAAGTDVTAPVIALPSDNTVTQGDSFDALKGVTATDNTDGDLSSAVSVIGTVDTATPGAYALVYQVADANGNLAQAARAVTVKAAASAALTKTSVTASNVSATFGTSPTLTATVSPADATGTIQFLNGEDELCEAAITDGRASCEVSVLPVPGAHAIIAAYWGDKTHAASQAGVVLTVQEAGSAEASATTVTGSSRSVVAGKSATVTVTVTGGSSVPTGTVRVSEGTKVLGTPSLSGGVAKLSFTGKAFPAGVHTLTLSYQGDALHTASSGTIRLTVKAVTSTTLKATKHGTRVTLRATVHPKKSGKIVFKDGSKTIATKTVKKGTAVVSVRLSAGKTHRIRAVFTPGNAATVVGSTSKALRVKVPRS